MGPPPIRRLQLDDPVAAEALPPAAASNGGAPQQSGFIAAKRSVGAPQFSIRRMEIDRVSVFYG
ncbi:MAG TPA: hypothetical protein VNR67_03785, partial [Solirubrobacterales bacterium]|nr:hypothetical protein [Solirubrobacterales bacterium]